MTALSEGLMSLLAAAAEPDASASDALFAIDAADSSADKPLAVAESPLRSERGWSSPARPGRVCDLRDLDLDGGFARKPRA